MKNHDLKTVYRVQDKDGRGPFIPGFSTYWLDDDISHKAQFPTWAEEFGHDLIKNHYMKGWHYGSAVLSLDGIRKWFSVSELLRLKLYGFSVIEMDEVKILAESSYQVVIGRRKPFTKDVRTIALPALYFEATL